MRKIFLLFAAMVGLMTGGCTHQIHADYAQYLVNNEGTVTFSPVSDATAYYLTPSTQDHSFEFVSAMGGLANTWAIQIGPVLDATMNGKDAQTAFGQVTKTLSPNANKGLLIIFDLKDYAFENFEASISLQITARDGASELLSKRYASVGISQGGKMFWGGGFAMKNAVQQSTKSAVDRVLTQFIFDLGKVYEGPGQSAGVEFLVLDGNRPTYFASIAATPARSPAE